MDLNKLTLIGYLTNDPEERTLPSGQTLVKFGLATHLVWRDAKSKELREVTEFHRVVGWGALGQNALQYLKKGSRVYVEGRLRQRRWKDKQGQDQSSQELSMSDLIFLSGTKRDTDEVAEEVEADEVAEE